MSKHIITGIIISGVVLMFLISNKPEKPQYILLSWNVPATTTPEKAHLVKKKTFVLIYEK